MGSKLQDKYCDGIYAYQIVRNEKGKEINTYHLEQAFIESPSYIIGDLFTRILDYETDGFSKTYYITFTLNTLLFIYLRLLYLRKTLLLFFNDRIPSDESILQIEIEVSNSDSTKSTTLM